MTHLSDMIPSGFYPLLRIYVLPPAGAHPIFFILFLPLHGLLLMDQKMQSPVSARGTECSISGWPIRDKMCETQFHKGADPSSGLRRECFYMHSKVIKSDNVISNRPEKLRFGQRHTRRITLQGRLQCLQNIGQNCAYAYSCYGAKDFIDSQ